MKYLYKKQKVLTAFYNQFDNNRYIPFDLNESDIYKCCLTCEKIHEKIKYDYDLVESILLTLKADGFISVFNSTEFDPYGIETNYYITALGKKAYFEKFYLSQSKLFDLSFWISIAAIIISVISIFY